MHKFNQNNNPNTPKFSDTPQLYATSKLYPELFLKYQNGAYGLVNSPTFSADCFYFMPS